MDLCLIWFLKEHDVISLSDLDTMLPKGIADNPFWLLWNVNSSLVDPLWATRHLFANGLRLGNPTPKSNAILYQFHYGVFNGYKIPPRQMCSAFAYWQTKHLAMPLSPTSTLVSQMAVKSHYGECVQLSPIDKPNAWRLYKKLPSSILVTNMIIRHHYTSSLNLNAPHTSKCGLREE